MSHTSRGHSNSSIPTSIPCTVCSYTLFQNIIHCITLPCAPLMSSCPNSILSELGATILYDKQPIASAHAYGRQVDEPSEAGGPTG
jgi:hypothetical protein